MDISDLKLQIDHLNGITAYIQKVRNLILSDKIILSDVFYVPEYTVNLLSVHKLARDSKLFIGFDEHKCYIQDLQLQKTLGTGCQRKGKRISKKDKIGSNPDKNGKRGEAEKSQKQLQSVEEEKLKKIQKKGPEMHTPSKYFKKVSSTRGKFAIS
nr:ribonuclease H-like domain-containing protein [Tanacetum cinerariifolium]